MMGSCVNDYLQSIYNNSKSLGPAILLRIISSFNKRELNIDNISHQIDKF